MAKGNRNDWSEDRDCDSFDSQFRSTTYWIVTDKSITFDSWESGQVLLKALPKCTPGDSVSIVRSFVHFSFIWSYSVSVAIYPQLYPEAKGWRTAEALTKTYRYRPTSPHQWYGQLFPSPLGGLASIYISPHEVTYLPVFMFLKLLFLRTCRTRSLLCATMFRARRSALPSVLRLWCLRSPPVVRLSFLLAFYHALRAYDRFSKSDVLLWCGILHQGSVWPCVGGWPAVEHSTSGISSWYGSTKAILRFGMPPSLLSMRAPARISSDPIECIDSSMLGVSEVIRVRGNAVQLRAHRSGKLQTFPVGDGLTRKPISNYMLCFCCERKVCAFFVTLVLLRCGYMAFAAFDGRVILCSLLINLVILSMLWPQL